MHVSQMGFHFTFGGKHGTRSIFYLDMYVNLHSSHQKIQTPRLSPFQCLSFLDMGRPSGQKTKEQVTPPPPSGAVWQHN